MLSKINNTGTVNLAVYLGSKYACCMIYVLISFSINLKCDTAGLQEQDYFVKY